nr:hypothetical protein [uncultured Rhodoferax sp.]
MTFDFATALGIVGSIASVVGLLLPAQGWHTKAMHAIYGFSVAVLAVGFTYYQSEVTELRKIEVQARKLADSQRKPNMSDNEPDPPGISDRGFMLAALTFFEKYREKFPDTYLRAKAFSEASGVLIPVTTIFSSEEEAQNKRLRDGASAMRALLEGVASGGLN